jgi:hypothetical protein
MAKMNADIIVVAIAFLAPLAAIVIAALSQRSTQSLKRKIGKTRIGLACCLLWLSMLACDPDLFRPVPRPTPSPTPWPLDQMLFQDPETGRRFRALDRCIRDITDDSWHKTSYQIHGNFYQASWCQGTVARDDCQFLYRTKDDHDQHSLTLYTLSRHENPPKFFGLGFSAILVPKSTGWGVLFDFHEKGETIIGEGWRVAFRKYVTPTGPAEGIIYLGSQYSYAIVDNYTIFDYSSDPILEDLAVYLSAPEAMRDRGLMRNQALARKVFAAINTHYVITCNQGPYIENEGGAEPPCKPRPLTPKEEAEELARAKTYFAEQEQALRDSYQEIYTAWMTAFPFDQCWP